MYASIKNRQDLEFRSKQLIIHGLLSPKSKEAPVSHPNDLNLIILILYTDDQDVQRMVQACSRNTNKNRKCLWRKRVVSTSSKKDDPLSKFMERRTVQRARCVRER